MGNFGKRQSATISISTSFSSAPTGRAARRGSIGIPTSNTSGRSRRRSKKPIFIIAVLLALIVVTIFLIKFLTTGKITITPGKIIYDSSLTSTEADLLSSTLGDYAPSSDVTISATTSTARSSSGLTYSIHVPVSDFYVSTLDISTSDLPDVNSTFTTPDGYTIEYIDLSDLTYAHRLLSLDGQYFFDDFNSGALFRTFSATGGDAQSVIDKISEILPTYPTKSQVLSLSQTGVTALSRAMVTKLNQVNDATYFSEKIASFLRTSDLTHISNEVSFATSCTGGTDTTSLCSDWRMLDTIQDIGTDIIELTGNHNNDYSTVANLETIAKYEELGLLTFGGGKDEETAAKPLEISQKDTHLTLLGYNESTSTKANGQGASGSQPGANIYDATTAQSDIATAKSRGDYIIVDIQYSECYAYPEEGTEMPACDAPISGQAEFFQSFIDLGADMVVGTQAHQPQTFELYKDKPIYYGLGNLFFDQTYWPGTERGIILTHYFYQNQLLQTRITPTVYDTNLQVQPMNQEDATWFINRLNAAR